LAKPDVRLSWDAAVAALGVLDELGGTDFLMDWPDEIDYEGPPLPQAANAAQLLYEAMLPFRPGDRVVVEALGKRGVVTSLILFSYGFDVEVDPEDEGEVWGFFAPEVLRRIDDA
jgi:hypothetical protein